MFPIHDDTERLHGKPYINYSLIAINSLVFIWEIAATGFFTDIQATREIFFLYGAIPEFVLAGNIPSIMTSMFMHGGIAHILGNMIFLYVFGDNIEDRFGHLKYLLIYVLWGVSAAFVHSIYAVNVGGGEVPAIGASGAISGVLGAYLVMFPRAKIFTVIMAFFITTVRIPALAFIPFWFILQIIFAYIVPQSGGVAYLAHIGGFITGMGTGYVWRLLSQRSRFKLQSLKKNVVTRKERPRLDDVVARTEPEVIEGPNFYEVIVEVRGASDASDIHASYEFETGTLRINVSGSLNYEMQVKLPETAVNPKVEYIHYLNGIAKIRLSK